MNFWKSILILIIAFCVFNCVWQNKDSFISDKYRDLLLKHYEIKPGNDDSLLRNLSKNVRIDIQFFCNKQLLRDKSFDKLITESNEVYSKCLDNTDCFFVKMMKESKPMSFGSYRIIFDVSNKHKTADIEDYYLYPPVSCKLKCLEIAIEEIENHKDYPSDCDELKIVIYLYSNDNRGIIEYYGDSLFYESFSPEIIGR